jgi:hypothetical protein
VETDKAEVLPFELAVLQELSGIRRALEALVLHAGVTGSALDELVGKMPRAKRKARRRRKSRSKLLT